MYALLSPKRAVGQLAMFMSHCGPVVLKVNSTFITLNHDVKQLT